MKMTPLTCILLGIAFLITNFLLTHIAINIVISSHATDVNTYHKVLVENTTSTFRLVQDIRREVGDVKDALEQVEARTRPRPRPQPSGFIPHNPLEHLNLDR